ncbi:Palmitoyltransferase, DHHC domain [Dillenia turbinata]|uniref:S-acyltransferase n=1 Tax=Dillenia turbinata TaxID=194707 RepID=A0AAN8Z9F8_9MAGN
MLCRPKWRVMKQHAGVVDCGFFCRLTRPFSSVAGVVQLQSKAHGNLKASGGGVWAVYPVVFSISRLCGILHSTITAVLSVATISSLSLAAFRCAGAPPSILWGSYPLVGKGGLENYTFCQYCSKPKSPRAHHCRSCGMCILDMDHHCPFIGNCVGAANHHSFIAFLIAAVVSMVYVTIMTAFAGIHLWPPLNHMSLGQLNDFKTNLPLGILKEIAISFLNAAMLRSTRGLILIYLFIASISVEIGLSVLLWQQLCYIYEGKTYLSELSSQGNDEVNEGECQNLVEFFSFPTFVSRYCPRLWTKRKRRKVKGDI